MIDQSLPKKSRAYWPFLKIVLGSAPGIFLAIYSYISLFQPSNEIDKLFPVLNLTIGGFAFSTLGIIFLAITYVVTRRLSYFSLGIGFGGLIMLATYSLAAYFIPWL